MQLKKFHSFIQATFWETCATPSQEFNPETLVFLTMFLSRCFLCHEDFKDVWNMQRCLKHVKMSVNKYPQASKVSQAVLCENKRKNCK